MNNSENCCCHKLKERPDEEKRKLINRLSRIEGQIRGIRGMVEEDLYCNDILVQASAVQAALNGFCRELLASHMKSCVVKDIKEGREDVIDELLETLRKLMR